MTRVETGSRLHFGLLGPPPCDGRRGFGGCGLMVEAPAVRVAGEPAGEWSASGPSAERALAVARRVAPDQPCRVVVEACPTEHVGLGVGTQLSLAVARAVIENAPHGSQGAECDAAELARLAGRGGRSAIGVHSFEQGGFLVDGGKCTGNAVAPLVARAEFPPEWRIVLLVPRASGDWHGDREHDVFARLSGGRQDDALCRLVLTGMMPALAEQDVQAFGDALREYNVRAGEPFRAVQGGPHSAAAADLIGWLRGQGLVGVGQSSWGPTAFAVVADEGRAAAVVTAARQKWAGAVEVLATAARNRGAGLVK
jgi:beta-RFAP synthase